MRVLRYLPTNLSAPEIARELSVSVTTVRTHVSHLFVKLGAHRRTEAVARARDLGLLAPSPMRRAGQPRATVLCPGPRCLACMSRRPGRLRPSHPARRTTTHAGRLGRRAQILPASVDQLPWVSNQDCLIMNSSSTASAEVGLRLVTTPQTIVPLTGSLLYSRRDPYAVRIAFHVGQEEPVEWIFARDLL
jgi:DNA-binding CsgD family transcriptional regulator